MLRARALIVLLILGRPAVCPAHEPGLSSLEVRVARAEIVADQSLTADDAAIDGGALEGALEVRLDGRRLPLVNRSDLGDGTGIHIRFASAHHGGRQVAVMSRVPRLLAPGHRQLISIRTADGRVLAERMIDASGGEVVADLTVTEAPAAAGSFFWLGLEHVAGGFDHLLFLAVLLFGVRRALDAVKTVSAFTVAHSITLAASTLGWVPLPASVVEPLIAGSIMYVAAENIIGGPGGSRAKLTFVFGLVHGFGFAGALRDLGVGAAGSTVAVPLAAFNAGVAAGQVALVLMLMPVRSYLRACPALGFRTAAAASAMVFAAGGYWLVERLAGDRAAVRVERRSHFDGHATGATIIAA